VGGRAADAANAVGASRRRPTSPLAARAAAALGGRNLALVGFMGAGKSTLGRAAARALGRPFVDTDALIVRTAGRTIPEVFAELGEDGFRALEAEAIAAVAGERGQVVATGGGALGRAANVAALRGSGVLVCLLARPEVILRRVGGAEAALRRPLLAGGDPLERIRTLLAARAALYAQADLALDTSDLERPAALQALLGLLAERAAAVRPAR
jgi:shikimate kinase